jgi:uncharacterized protein (DUF362 family)
VKYLACISRIDDLCGEIARNLEFVRWKEACRTDSTVFLKPNFTYPASRPGITTNPAVLAPLLGILKDRCSRVIVGESDGGNHSFTADDSFLGHGMEAICKETGAELVNLSKTPPVFVADTIQGKYVKVQLPRMLVSGIDCFVSVPVLKVHVMTGVTLSMKNLWGCYPDTMRLLHHKHLDRKLALMTRVLNPRLVLIDGTYGLDGHGPMYGTPKPLNLLIASNNPVVADSLGARVMGFSPEEIGHITMAAREGLGTTDLEQVTLNQDWKQFAMQFSVQKTRSDLVSTLFFNSELLPKLAFDSPLTPLIYRFAGLVRNQEERELAEEMQRYRT